MGDAKYKDVTERAGSECLDSAENVFNVGIQAADWNQLYVYMRMKRASSGFFVVPFWDADGEPFAWREGFRFADRPADTPERVAVLALNLLKPLTGVKRKAAERLHDWLSLTTS